MGKGRLGAAVAVASLTFAATAFAGGKVTLSGPVEEDPAASVKLVVVKDGGAPKSVKNVRIKNLRTNCERGKARIELNLSGAAKVNDRRKFHMAYVDGKSKVVLDGKVRADSKKVVGEISGSSVHVDGAGDCKIPNRSFKAKK
jgi:3'-phosphoadenosine 5'-phosphosulfate sulfotransferase